MPPFSSSPAARPDGAASGATEPPLTLTAADARWEFDPVGGGFARLLDRDGHDWLGYNPAAGARGRFRGTPNLVFRLHDHPNNFFHAGHRGPYASRTTVHERSPGFADFSVAASRGAWKVHWTLDTTGADLTVDAVDPADPAHWFLYEGTPGGHFDPADYCLRSDGTRDRLAASWASDSARLQWVAFVSRSARRSLLITFSCPEVVPVSYRPMEEAMTVFGVGRDLGLPTGFLRRPGGRFHLALVESILPEGIRDAAKLPLRLPKGGTPPKRDLH